jgi:apolipoprotein N-acyltransferase
LAHLKFDSFRSLPACRFLLAASAGLMLAAAFPNLGLAGLAWVAPGLLLASVFGKTGWERFRIGYVGGLAFYLAALYWLLYIPYQWHGIPLGPAAGWLALSGYVALYPAAWVWLLSSSSKTRNVAQIESDSHLQQLLNLGELLPRTWSQRCLWALSGAASWVALEMVLARLFSGFPWLLLGITQYKLVPLIQIASVTGVYGLSFLCVWGSLSLLSAVVMLLRRAESPSMRLAEIFIPLVIVSVLFQFGLRQIRQPLPSTRTLKVTFVQPSIPQTLIWDQTKDEERFQNLIQLSRDALTNRTDLLLWPEAAIPKLFRWDKATYETVTGLARQNKVWMIVGADDAEPRQDGKADYFNSSFLINPQGEVVQGYKKRGLVIFGEYIPLVRWLPFMKFFTPIPGGFTAGDRAVQFDLSDLQIKACPLICFEDVFPQWAREGAQPDTDFLVNLTNDGWFGESAEPWQHAASSVFRAVENRVPLFRCTNTGITCWVDPEGRFRQIFTDQKGSVYGPGIMRAEIPLAGSVGHSRTFYNKRGDWFGWLCVAVAGLQLSQRMLDWARKKSSRR